MPPDDVLVLPPREIPPLAVNCRDAARLLGISEPTLRSVTAPRGSLPVTRINNRALYRVASLDAWLAAQERKGAGE